MESWLLEALKQGGMFALAVFAIWQLNRVWNERVDEAKRSAEQMKQMWCDTKAALENNTAVISAWMERQEMMQQRSAGNQRKTIPPR